MDAPKLALAFALGPIRSVCRRGPAAGRVAWSKAVATGTCELATSAAIGSPATTKPLAPDLVHAGLVWGAGHPGKRGVGTVKTRSGPVNGPCQEIACLRDTRRCKAQVARASGGGGYPNWSMEADRSRDHAVATDRSRAMLTANSRRPIRMPEGAIAVASDRRRSAACVAFPGCARCRY